MTHLEPANIQALSCTNTQYQNQLRLVSCLTHTLAQGWATLTEAETNMHYCLKLLREIWRSASYRQRYSQIPCRSADLRGSAVLYDIFSVFWFGVFLDPIVSPTPRNWLLKRIDGERQWNKIRH
ncbi:hypothetical protein CY34DRAFT_798768 [Suillus luteus UH-Slu-Lm8-n1]|uniref:Uncharacterized protein n=1 Tax=Suillus luteus UH-Slu-Lm8-n1 TaxID=930992 RepID=A0A0D0BQE3_9AGAM|nr:hypothetical protein CY34DRAFT_798768 [Suillus luteus UH-Slu-Lm8-n1]